MQGVAGQVIARTHLPAGGWVPVARIHCFAESGRCTAPMLRGNMWRSCSWIREEGAVVLALDVQGARPAVRSPYAKGSITAAEMRLPPSSIPVIEHSSVPLQGPKRALGLPQAAARHAAESTGARRRISRSLSFRVRVPARPPSDPCTLSCARTALARTLPGFRDADWGRAAGAAPRAPISSSTSSHPPHPDSRRRGDLSHSPCASRRGRNPSHEAGARATGKRALPLTAWRSHGAATPPSPPWPPSRDPPHLRLLRPTQPRTTTRKRSCGHPLRQHPPPRSPADCGHRAGVSVQP